MNYYYFISGLIGILTMVILRKTTDEKKLLARTSADLDGEEKIRQKDIEKVPTCRELDKSNSKMVVVK